ncbi:MAG: hypothetical protein JXA71_15605 [Chitinispirillaceae bacterium]|nr:hypothetical protein [Chitinispirillaceae bacterium]
MNVRKVLGEALIVTAIAAVATLSAPPGLWMYTDEYGSPGYSGVELVDTMWLGPPYEATDSTFGILRDDAYDYTESVMAHFKWPYQFTKGWAACKLIWEDRDWAWEAYGYDSLVIKYIGPLATHKIDIYFGLAFTRFDSAFVEYIGSIPANPVSIYSSEAWKTVTLPLPPAPTNTPIDSMRKYLREVRFIIHNADGETSLTSPQGYFYLDKVGLVKASGAGTVTRNRMPATVSGRTAFVPASSGRVMLSLFTIDGKELFRKPVEVMAGCRYDITRFATGNAPFLAQQARIVRITGQGLAIQERIH